MSEHSRRDNESTDEKKKELIVAKRKATLAKRSKIKKIENMYSVIATEMPSEWVKSDDNKLELVRAIHKDALGLDKNGKLRPMSDFIRFMNVANQAGLNPFLNEIYGLYFYDKAIKSEKLTIITGIGGFRKAAAMDQLATMRYVGSSEPTIEFKKERLPEYADLFKGRDIPNKVTIDIKGLNPITGEIQTVSTGIAYWDEYVKLVDEKEYIDGTLKKTGRRIPNSNWLDKPIVMLKKCFDDETEVLTNRGFMLFSDVERFNAKVMQVTPTGIEPTLAKPFSQDYAGEMICCDGKKLDFCVTPDHTMIIDDGKLIDAEDLYSQSRAYNFTSIPTAVSNHAKTGAVSDDEIKLAAWYLADGSYVSKNLFYVDVVSDRKKMMLDELPYLSKKVRIRKTASLWRSTANCGTRVEYRFEKNKIEWLCKDKETINFDAILGLSERQARLFVNTLLGRDYNIFSGNAKVFNQSRDEILSLIELASICAGYSIGNRRVVRSTKGGKQHKCITISASVNARIGMNRLLKTNYNGKVWCVTVPSHKIIVRRRGYAMVCGNCAEADGLRKAYPNRLNAVYERAEMSSTYDATEAECVDDDTQAKLISEAVEARRKRGSIFDEKTKGGK